MTIHLASQGYLDSMLEEINATEGALESIGRECSNISETDLVRDARCLSGLRLLLNHLDMLENEFAMLALPEEDAAQIQSEIARLRSMVHAMIHDLGCRRDDAVARSIILHNEQSSLLQRGLLELGYLEHESQPPQIPLVEVLLTFISLVLLVTQTFATQTEQLSESLGFSNFSTFQFILFSILLLLSYDFVLIIGELSKSRTKKLRKMVEGGEGDG
jgi:hypothetical protein